MLVDDEQMALKSLEQVLTHFSGFKIGGSFTDPQEARACIAANIVDVIFLDTEMPGMLGMQLAEDLLQTNPDLIAVFVAADDQYALEAFRVGAQDYLLKPVTVERMARAVAKVNRQYELIRTNAASSGTEVATRLPIGENNKIAGKKNGRFYLLAVSNIEFLFSRGRHVFAVAGGVQYELEGCLADWELYLKETYIRCHKSFLINLDRIEYIAPLFKSHYTIKLQNAQEGIPVGRGYVKTLKKRLRI